MLTVGKLVIPDVLSGAKEICTLNQAVAELWVNTACMSVQPHNTTEWLEQNSLKAIVVQSKGYAVIVVDHWSKDNYRLVEIPQK